MGDTPKKRLGDRSVSVVRGTDKQRARVTWWSTGDGRFVVALRGPFGELTAVESDVFEALVSIRRRLEAAGWALAVQGARRDVYPSPQARRRLVGQRVCPVDLDGRAAPSVMIFDDADPSVLATVEEQEAFWDAYVTSPRGRVRHLLGEHAVTVVRAGQASPATIRWWLTDDYFSGVELTGPFGREATVANDFFSALVAIRRRIEPDGWTVAVQGARRDVYPPRLTQGGSRKIGFMGDDPRHTVSTFDPVDPALAVTVDDQSAHWPRGQEESPR